MNPQNYHQGGQGSSLQNRPYQDKRAMNAQREREREEILAKFKPTWVTNGADAEMIQFTEEAGKYLASNGMTSSQLRNVYGEIKRIQMQGYDKERSSFFLLKPKVAYAVGRAKSGQKQGLDALLLFKQIFDKCHSAVKDSSHFENFCKLMEALLAYHRAYGGKE